MLPGQAVRAARRDASFGPAIGADRSAQRAGWLFRILTGGASAYQVIEPLTRRAGLEPATQRRRVPAAPQRNTHAQRDHRTVGCPGVALGARIVGRTGLEPVTDRL